MFQQLALLAAQMYLGIVTQPRPKRATFEEFLEANKGDETRPIPYIRGRWKTTPQRIWLGDFSARAVERDSHWSDYLIGGALAGPLAGIGLAALLDTITVGYSYYVGQVLALTWGPINRVHQVYVDELLCAVSPAGDNAGGTILLDFPTAWGGDQPPGLGGIGGLCDILPGTYTQPRNAYLADRIGPNIPALHGIAALVVRGRTGLDNYGYFGANQNPPSLRTWQVELMAWPDNFNSGFHRLSDDSYNRVDVLYEWITKPDYGAEYPIESIYMPSWLAAEQTCFNEGLGFSGEINTGGNVGSVIEQLKASIDAEVFEHPRDGLKIKLIRKDYSIPALPLLNETNIAEVEEYTPGDYADTFNRVLLPFENTDNNFQPRHAVYEDPANFHIQRRMAVKEIQYPGVARADLAQKLVTRDGRMLGQPWPPLTVRAGEVARELYPGECYKFEWPDPLIEKVFRVTERTPSVSYDGDAGFRVVSTEDQYSTGLAAFGDPSDTGFTHPQAGCDTPPSAGWDTTVFSPDGLQLNIDTVIGGALSEFITGAIIFGSYNCAQVARIWVTEPEGVETLSPMKLAPDADNKAQFVWPAVKRGDYTFCIQTFDAISGATNGVKVCATIAVASPSPSASVSPSVSPSASLSPSASQSPSASVSPSPSGSTSPSASISPSASQSPSSSVSPSGFVDITDDFNRANSSTTLNTSSSGHEWTAHVGTWGIDTNQGYLPTPVADSVVTIESSEADVTVQVTLAIVTNRPGLSFRFVDTNNYWAAFRVGGLGYSVAKRVIGSWTTVHNESMATANGDILKIVTNGSTVELWVNGVLRETLSGQTDHSTATRHGLYHETGGTADGRWEDFSITQ